MPGIAILGWGSLLWRRKSLHNEGAWKTNGPWLPIEFARISGKGSDQYLSLVIDPRFGLVRTYWDCSLEPDLDSAVENLREREGCSSRYIGRITQDDALTPIPVDRRIQEWLNSKRGQIDAVILTGLPPKLEDGIPLTVDNCIAWLEQRMLGGEHEAAKEYIQMAPKQTDTCLRRQVRERFGWEDISIGY